jgi:hypothetical protein
LLKRARLNADRNNSNLTVPCASVVTNGSVAAPDRPPLFGAFLVIVLPSVSA